MFKSVVVIALCAFAVIQCKPTDESAAHERVRRQMPMPGDFMNIPLKAGADLAHTFTGFGEKLMGPGNPQGQGNGNMPGGMGQMGK